MVDTTLVLPLRGRPAREVLLGYKQVGFGAGKLTGVGGKIEAYETPAASAAREVEEEIGLRVRPQDLGLSARLDFCFPHRPEWSTVMYVFCAWHWQGAPAAGREIVPAWYAVDAIPYGQMWADSTYWLPRVLAGERVRGLFYFAADNETVARAEVEAWDDESLEGM
ncbi:MAG TPA: NUDIX domain-containing protein [Anaerolineae bacterium]|nr:NUDIX domain-containing protein [Anaerolineae bacterium]